uniref:Variant surface glycoprotein n=1 Tax=Trypanosoma brucei TaxID=5691 RepID=A0A1V0FXS5_9TRYP|nr:variant surface glycoprotein [Trypanosoma brucei]
MVADKVNLLPYTLCLVCAIGHTAATAGDAIKQKYWLALCDLAVDADAIANTALSNLKQPATAGESNLQNLLRALVYHMANSTEPANKGEAMLWSHFAAEAETAFKFYSSDKPGILLTAVRNAARANGAILDWIDVQHKTSDGTYGCLSSNNAGATPTTGSTELNGAAAKCKTNWEAVKATETPTTAVTATGLHGAFESAVVHGTLASGAHQCNSNGAHNAFTLARQTTGTDVRGRNIGLAAGILTPGANGLETKALKTAADIQQTHPYVYHLVDAFDKAKTKHASADISTLDKAKTAEQLKRQARIHLLNLRSDETSGDSNLADEIGKAFGSPEKYTAIYSRNVDEMPLTKELTHDPNLKKLGEITDINDLMRLYFFFSNQLKHEVKDLKEKLAEAKRQQAPKPAEDKEKECNTKGKDKQEECEKLAKDGCVFNTETKKCELKKEVKEKLEKESQETEGKDGKTDCSKLTTQPECEAANTAGKPATCGWRSGKDNEDEKDKVKCRNGSFLVNREFALSVVSAAFVALLF